MAIQTISTPKQYIVTEDGKRTGVVLDWETYEQLRAEQLNDPDLLPNLSESELKLLAEGMLAAPYQSRLNELLKRNQTGKINQNEEAELDDLLAQVDQMNILKARALYTLQQQS